VNRLIIIGNGFDLAHGLETKYNDFMLWYLKKCYGNAYEKGDYEDDLLTIKKVIPRHAWFTKINSTSDLINHLYTTVGFNPLIHNDANYRLNELQEVSNPFNTTFKSDFLRLLLSKCNFSTWVEVENEYYEELKRILYASKDPYRKPQKLNDLNNSFAFIIKQLEEYLKTIPQSSLHPGFGDIFESPIYKTEILKTKWEDDILPNKNLILNFNYTSTVEQYFRENRSMLPIKRIEVNYIHGKLKDKKNPIIFGFGDELDPDYTKMELEKVHGYFDYIKSFGYFKTSNYHNLIRFLDAEEYQVFILGHSCGLSDRTMLNMIFEHDNCKSIRIFYYVDVNNNNNFTPLTEEISRHFKDKAMMRRKIVPFDKSSPMPQVK
jgi:hypothetical protein